MSNIDINEPLPADAAPREESFGEILSQFERSHHKPDAEPDPSSAVIDGTVISVGPEYVYVDIGRKHEGVLPLEAVREASGAVALQPGHGVRVSVAGLDENGYHVLSLYKVVVPKDWTALENAFRDGAVISGTVQEVIKGGLRVDVGVRAFLPASRSGARDSAEMEKLVGQTIECRITKLDTEKEDVVLDRRGVLEERAAKAKREAFDAVEEGSIRQGTVRSIQDYGAFVDLGGVDGLLHVADMTWLRGAKPSDVVKVGDTVQVKVLRVDRAKGKISLGLKQLTPDPWTVALSALKTGDRVRGKVVRTTDFGAFVELQPGVEGMIHVSEMSWSKKQKRPADILKPGEMVEVIVLGIKPEEKRIALGLKQALGDPWEDAVQKYKVGSVVEAPVSTLAPFGAFVDIAEGVEGMIHIGDIVNNKRLQHPKEALAVGQVVRAQVLEIDHDRKRFRLGMKQLEPTSVDEYIAENKVGDVVSGRVVESGTSSVRVELGEGVKAVCRLKGGAAHTEVKPAAGADLSASVAMLAARWKAGSVKVSAAGTGLKSGEVRQFRITLLDPAKKLIEVELAD